MPVKFFCLTIIAGTAYALANGMHGFSEPGESFPMLLGFTTLIAFVIHGGFLLVMLAPALLVHRIIWWTTAFLLSPVTLAAMAGVAEGFNKWRGTPWLLVFSTLFAGLYGVAWSRLLAIRRTSPAFQTTVPRPGPLHSSPPVTE